MGLSNKKTIVLAVIAVAIVGVLMIAHAHVPVETCVWPHLCAH